MNVLCCDPPLQDSGAEGDFVTLDRIADEADIITFHTPLTRGGDHPTFHLADYAFFSSLKKRPLIINSSRGEVVDNDALVRAIDEGLVCDAVIDTWENEPEISLELMRRAVIATPHIAGYSADGKANATRMSLQAVCHFARRPFALEVCPPELPEELRPTSAVPSERALQLYNPMEDSARLKHSPEKFEWLRGNYPLRREEE